MKETNTENKELDLLLSSKEIRINNKVVVVKRFSLLNTVRIASKLSAIVGLVLNGTEATASALNKAMYTPKDADVSEDTINSIRFMGMIELIGLLGEEGADLLSDLLVKGTNLSYDEIEEVDAVDGVELVFTMYEVNKGFFTKFMSKLEKKLTKSKKEKKQTNEK